MQGDGKRSRLPDIAVMPMKTAMNQTPAAHFPWWMENAGSGVVDVFIYDEITDPTIHNLFGIGISSQSFAKDLRALKGTPLMVHIDSPGGLVAGGIAIYNLIRGHDAHVTTVVDGMGGSIASVIAMAGDDVLMAPRAQLYIHEAHLDPGPGNADDFRHIVEILDQLSANIAAVYVERGNPDVDFRARMQNNGGRGSLISAEEAVALGLADRVDRALGPARNQRAVNTAALTERDAERALHEKGFTRSQAKAILARGWDEPAPAAPREAADLAPLVATIRGMMA